VCIMIMPALDITFEGRIGPRTTVDQVLISSLIKFVIIGATGEYSVVRSLMSSGAKGLGASSVPTVMTQVDKAELLRIWSCQ